MAQVQIAFTVLLTAAQAFSSPEFLFNVGGEAAQVPQQELPSRVTKGRVALLTTYFGAYPELKPDSTGRVEWCNGGIPQLANLTRHFESMQRDMDLRVPKNFTGFIVHDYESWAPPWGRTDPAYKNASIALARSLLPKGSPESAILSKAEHDYDEAAVHFLAFTVNASKKLRPHAAGVGFYGYPLWTYFGNDTIHVQISKLNDQLEPLWRAQNVLYPSLYLPFGSLPGCVEPGCSTPAMQRRYIDTHMQEAARLSIAHSGGASSDPLPILPYTWYRYHDGEPHGMEFLNATDAELEFVRLFNATAYIPAAIIWGDEKGPGVAQLLQWFKAQATIFGSSSVTDTSRGAINITQSAALPGGDVKEAGASMRPVPQGGPIPPYTPCSL